MGNTLFHTFEVTGGGGGCLDNPNTADPTSTRVRMSEIYRRNREQYC